MQRWFLDEVASVPAKRPRAPAVSVVLPSATLAAEERMDIYRHMYVARLVESLAVDFPGVKLLLGEPLFDQVGTRYIAEHPPTSWTLNDLGAHFPAFLRSVRRLPQAALVRDVASMERAMSEAFDAADAFPLTRADVAAVDASEWTTARLDPTPTLRVLALKTRANPVVTALRRGRPVPRRLGVGPSWVAVYRKDLRVWRLDLTGPTHAALSALVRGKPLASAVDAASRVHDGDAESLPMLIRIAFSTWIEEGLFIAVRRTAVPR